MGSLVRIKKEKEKVSPCCLSSFSFEAKCPGGCRNGGFCNERQVCECQDGFYGIHCEKGKSFF